MKKNFVGRPPIINDEVMKKLEQCFSLGSSDLEACIFADISPATLYNYQKEHPEFLERKQLLKEKPILKARNTIVKSLDDPKIALEYLKAKCKSEFGQRMEITGPDGANFSPPIINVLPVKTKDTETNG